MSGDSGRPELDADPGADATAGLGHGVFPRPLAAAAHHDQIPVAERKSQPGPTTARAKLQHPGRADGQDRDHGVRVRTSTDPVSVPRHAVGSVAVQTPVSYTHLRAHETDSYLVCRLLLEKKKTKKKK